MIYIHIVVLEPLMLHAKFHWNQSTGSGEEDFWRVSTIYGHGGHLGHVTWISYIHIGSPFLLMLHIKFSFDLPSGFRGEDLWNCERTTDGRTTDGRTPDHGHPISSPCEPNDSGELTIFSIQMHGRSKLTLPWNRSRSSQCHDLYKFCRPPFLNASCQVSTRGPMVL